jgi:hypothetical protein
MLPKACATMGELSVRMVVPMAMKKLWRPVSADGAIVGSNIPKCGCRTCHVLSKGSQHAVWPGSESNDVCEA